jgi:signal transduction histidine kinase
MSIDLQYSPQSRTERLISLGRVVLASSSLLAIWLDPLQPAKHQEETYVLMAVYLVYAVVVAVLVRRSRLFLYRLRLATHVVDLLAFSMFMVLTEGPPTSPFFVYFVFSILGATLRWGWRGTLWTALVALGTFVAMGLSSGYLLDDERLNRFIIRCGYLAVIAVMIGYLGAYEQQLRGEIARLAAWPRAVRREPRQVVGEVLAHASEVFGAPRVVMVWDEPDEPWANMAAWSSAGFEWERLAPGTFDPVVDEALAADVFFCVDVAAPGEDVVALPATAHHRRSGPVIHPALRERHAMRAVLSVRCAGDAWDGRLFFLDKARMNVDDAVLGQVVARHVAAALDHLYVQQRLQQAAVMEERVRFARDLHDGLLQSLTGTGLQLETVRRVLRQEPQVAIDRLADIQHLIVAEQRNLRSYIRDLKPAAFPAASEAPGLRATLQALAERVESHWGLRVTLTAGDLAACEAAGLGHHVSHIVHEALVNAARHGGASAAAVTVEERGQALVIVVADNGHGFPFHGRHDLAALQAMQAGPVSLKERTAALHGGLTIESDGGGARLEITLPLDGDRV